MSQEIVLRMLVFQFLLQSGYTIKNALIIIKRPLNLLSDQVQNNYYLFMKLMLNTFDKCSSAIDNIKKVEELYINSMKKKVDSLETIEESESKTEEDPQPSLETELPRYNQ